MFRSILDAINSMYQTVMPGFWLRLKPAYQWAAGIAIVVVVWVASGQLTGHAKPIEDANAAKPSGLASVRVAMLVATSRDATITIRGKTQAKQEVDVRAEVEGVVQSIHFDKGDRVHRGDTLCE